MKLPDIINKIKVFSPDLSSLPDLPKGSFILLFIPALFLGIFSSLWLADIERLKDDALRVESIPNDTLSDNDISVHPTLQVASHDAASTVKGMYVGSSGGKKYYFPTCAGARRIKDENKIWFTNAEEAQLMGYEPAKTCPGL